MPIPRKHHYVPRFYLGGFTDTGEQDGRLTVLDKESGRQWHSSPGDAGCEKDFYMLEVEEDGDALAIEKCFVEVEAKGSAAIR